MISQEQPPAPPDPRERHAAALERLERTGLIERIEAEHPYRFYRLGRRFYPDGQAT